MRIGRFGALATTLAVTVGLVVPLGVGAATAAQAVAPEQAGFDISVADAKFILAQIQIAEAHRTADDPQCTAQNAVNGLTIAECAIPGTNPLVVGSVNPNDIPDPRLPDGLRQVDGRNNNLMNGFSQWNGVTYSLVTGTGSALGAADMPFPRIAPELWRSTTANPTFNTQDGSYALRNANLTDSAPRTISNLVADQSAYNPAAVQASGYNTAGMTDAQKKAIQLNVPNTTPAGGLAPPANAMFTFFGQFFDHGLDLVGKTSSNVVIVPLEADDPLYVPGSPTNFMALNRTVVSQNAPAGSNSTTPWIDQNQTYTSHPSHQVFLRAYGCGIPAESAPNTVCSTATRPVATGSFLDGSPAKNLASWADVKLQALNKLGIELTDYDVTNVPLLATDEYGRFLRGPNGFPLVMMANDTLVEGDPLNPVQTVDFTNPTGPVDLIRRTGHAFLDDIAHDSAPKWTWNSVSWVAAHNVAHLGQHFITGDGRGNENIALSAIHTVFHNEHNRLLEQFKALIVGAEGNAATNTQFAFSDWHTGNSAQSPWNGERLFQASRFVNEMEYQHLVFGEFARRIQPLVRAFAAYDPTLNPDIAAEFAHAVYRFGHSQLDETVERTAADGTDNSLPLFQAFLSPEKFNKNYNNGVLTADEAVGQIVRGSVNQTAQEIDEFVTGALRNQLLGLPLDLATLNLARGRDTAMNSLNGTRAALGLREYTSWSDFGASLRHSGSLVNFIAAYGTHPSITSATTIADKRAAAAAIVDLGSPNHPVDGQSFLTATGAWSPTPVQGQPGVFVDTTGLKDIDLWIGGLAERRPVAGGLLGETFDGVFKVQMENLQEGDRLYYLGRLAGLNLTNQIETNLFSNIIIRNSDATALPALIFDRPTLTFDMSKPAATYPQITVLPDTTWRYTGTEHAVFSGTAAADGAWSGSGDDTVRGNDAGDTVNGGDGNDNVIAGAGDDVIDDNAGVDILIGASGNDYITSSGSGADAYFGGAGQDFLVATGFGTVQSGGFGDDIELGGSDADGLSGDDGSDWLEGGLSGDTLSGDILAPFGFDLAPPGLDVLSGDAGNNIDDLGGGSDVSVGGFPGTNTILGGLGFDWRTYYNPRSMAAHTADLSLNAPAPGNVQQGLQDTFLDTEALSGGDLNDTLTGDIRTTLAVVNTPGDNLNAADIPSFGGLATLLGVNANNQTITSWNTGDILIGGAGADSITGQQGDDLIDGDAYLEVKLSVPNVPGITGTTTPDPADAARVLIDSAQQVKALVRAKTITTPQIRIVRTIKWATRGAELDTAVYTGPLASYTLATGPGGVLRVTDNRAGGGNEGVDTLRNIERIAFSDQTINVSAPLAPRNVAVSGAGLVSWQAPVNNAGARYAITGYTARAWDAATGTVLANSCTTNANTLQCTPTGLTAGRSYYFDVVATSAVGNGIIAPAPRLARYLTGTPAAPTNVVATAGSSVADVSWSTTAGPGANVVFTARAYDAAVNGALVNSCTGTDITSCQITGLVNGTTYYVDVNASSAGQGNRTSTPRVAVTPIANVPTAPGNPVITPGNGQVGAVWTAPVNDGGSAVIEYTATAWTAASGGVAVSSCATATLGCTLSGLPNGATYYVSVAARNGTGTGAASQRVATTPVAAPSKPAKPNATAVNAGSVTVGWTAPNANGSAIVGYTASAYTVSSGGSPVAFCSTQGAVSCNITGLAAGTAYYVGVVATNGVGSSTESTRALVPGVPSTVSTPSVTFPALGTARVSWTAPSANGSPITGYTVAAYSAPSGGAAVRSCLWQSGATTCDITGLSAGTTYYIGVIATNTVGNSTESARATAALPTAPAAPAAPSVSYPALGSVKVDWTAPNNGGSAITGYTVKAYNGPSGGASVGQCVTNGALTCTITGLTVSSTYYIGVTAANSAASSTESSRTSATLPTRPSRLAAPSVTFPTNGALTAWFAAPASHGGTPVIRYQANVYNVATGGTAVGWCTANSATSCNVTGLARGGTYYVTIVAINSVGASPYSVRTKVTLPKPASAPRNLSVTSAGVALGSLKASWTAPLDLGGSPLSRYEVRVYTSSTGGSPVATCTAKAVTSCTVSGLVRGGLYFTSVVAITGAGAGASSAREPLILRVF